MPEHQENGCCIQKMRSGTSDMKRTLRIFGWILTLMIALALGCRQVPERTVTVRVISHRVPPSSFLSITGNNDQLENWKPEGARLQHRADSV
jgi:hypothetical protein